MDLVIRYDYGDFVVEWDGWTGVILLFSQDGERIGGLPRAYSQEEAEELLRQHFGRVADKKTIRPALLNLFPFP